MKFYVTLSNQVTGVVSINNVNDLSDLLGLISPPCSTFISVTSHVQSKDGSETVRTLVRVDDIISVSEANVDG